MDCSLFILLRVYNIHICEDNIIANISGNRKVLNEKPFIMQKFVVKKSKSAIASQQSATQPLQQQQQQQQQPQSQPKPDATITQVKMSGYLKKKRNKMGGWRKLWFVLQNQLLLSYSSKEDYEKKLAPFKDVLNLVPGTIIRPTKGPRFIIETSTNIIYTYRCDNNKVCSEWITALVGSLSPGSYAPNGDKKLPMKVNKLHYSMDNIQKPLNGKVTSSLVPPFSASRSCESIYRSKSCKSPKLPIAQNTAKIIERAKTTNGSGNGNGNERDPPHQLQQSQEEHQKKNNTELVQNFRLHQADLNVNQSYEVHRINRMFGRRVAAAVAPAPATGAGINATRPMANSDDSSANHLKVTKTNGFNKLNKRELIMDSVKATNEINGNAANLTIEEQVQRISLDHRANHDSFHSSSVEQDSGASAISSSSASSTSSYNNISNQLNGLFKISNPNTILNDLNEGSQQKCQTKDTNNATTPLNVNITEPIYAVVNLKNKYARRAKIREELEEDVNRERPNSFHVVSSDYEEVLQLTNCIDHHDEDDNENIYEPINIPDISPKSPLWRYFSKINIEALVEITRWKKENREENTTTFSDIRKRFGHHRKSIKNRMRKFYNRSGGSVDVIDDDVAECDKCPNGSNEDLGSQGASCSSASESGGRSSSENNSEKGSFVMSRVEAFRKRDRHLFGSIGLLKKSRTSACLEDAAPRKKVIVAAKTTNFPQDMKKKCGKSLIEKGKQCHSKFYD